ncbi:hypothetical protein pdam_00009369 [Pocillopora damicornis]|uniref:Uncharacterized protein n=1 Tax=Pocillopora damicornis TaxID=46731 RepID=A0A3M6TXJ1_POCDA|nr:hypothetical protein pdam_00009369 [Pocillopora damicornis]
MKPCGSFMVVTVKRRKESVTCIGRGVISPTCMPQKTYYQECAARTIKLVSGLTGTVSFLRNLESLYDSFGIGAHTIDAAQLSLQDAVCNVSSVNALKKQSLK